ncbi:hypothetical protein AN958_09733 [Leucoagaricus sp. SymC.cos]|nr:hypothetical protein AN958_09733 [Leucoagaricus sp. SymC.cos]
MQTSFTTLPPEILLKIVSLLELHDVARIRQSCKRLQEIAQDKSIWGSLLANQRSNYPIPPWLDFSKSPASLRSISQVDLERAVVTIQRVARAWRRKRPTPLRVQPRLGDMLLTLEMFLDRWLLVVYAEGLICLWDTASKSMLPLGTSGTTSRAKFCARLVDENEDRQTRWTSCAAQLSDDSQKLVILCNIDPLPTPSCRVYEISLKANASSKLIATVRLPEQEIIRAISFTDKMLILSRGSAINFVDINNKPRRNLTWNAAIDIRMFSRHIFVFKSRSIEVHDMDSLIGSSQREFTAIPIAKHFFQNTTYREVKFSDSSISTGEQLDISFQAFAYDVLQGLFNYSIHFQARPDHPPDFTVALVNIYPLASHVVPQFSHLLPSDVNLLTPSPTPVDTVRRAFRPTNPSSRGFISAYTIGSQAKRAVWAERVRGSTLREIQVWDRSETVNVDGDFQQPGEIERIPVHSLPSPDLREDITRCALSESTGLIVLGNRAGELFLLDVDL